MAKRFSSTELWDEDWFLEMPTEYKLYWFYMLAKCDHAGLFKVNTKKFSIVTGLEVSPKKAIEFFNNGKERIREVANNTWLIEDFFVFQYGSTLNSNSKVHESVQKLYNQANINLTSIRGLKDLKDRVKDKDKDIDKDIKKGGTGENKKGVRFDENFQKVYFDDGSFQELGMEQKILAKGGDIRPLTIIKGSIY